MKCQLCEYEVEVPMIDSFDKKNLTLNKKWELHFYSHGASDFKEAEQIAFACLKKYGTKEGV